MECDLPLVSPCAYQRLLSLHVVEKLLLSKNLRQRKNESAMMAPEAGFHALTFPAVFVTIRIACSEGESFVGNDKPDKATG